VLGKDKDQDKGAFAGFGPLLHHKIAPAARERPINQAALHNPGQIIDQKDLCII